MGCSDRCSRDGPECSSAITRGDIDRRMHKALVTGAPGFVGAHIVRQLVDLGVRVRGLALPGESLDTLDGVDVEIVRADVRDIEAMKTVVAGIDTVFHGAAIYEGFSADPERMYEVNLRGTFNVLEAARRAEVERVVYTASVVALGRPEPGKLADENTRYEAWDVDFHYSRSKFSSMLIASDFAAWGLDVRIVCPGTVVGPGDARPTPSGDLLLSIAQGQAPGYTTGGTCYVDVRDVAAGHIAAAQRGTAGERYVLGGHNLKTRDFIAAACRAAGIRAIPIKIPLPAARAWVRGRQHLALRRGDRPDVGAAMFDYAIKPCFFDSRKAMTELGVGFRPIAETLSDALAWFRDAGMLAH